MEAPTGSNCLEVYGTCTIAGQRTRAVEHSWIQVRTMTGEWYLVYGSFDPMENHISNAVYQTRVKLKSVSEGPALVEATAAWSAALGNGYHGWNKIFYPRQPRLIYEIPLLPGVSQ